MCYVYYVVNVISCAFFPSARLSVTLDPVLSIKLLIILVYWLFISSLHKAHINALFCMNIFEIPYRIAYLKS